MLAPVKLELYTPDAVFTNPDGSSISDEKGMRQLFVKVYAGFDSDLHLHTERVRPAIGGGCVEQGKFRENLHDRRTGVVTPATGKYRFTYRQGRDLRWRFAAMSWMQDRGKR